MTKFSQGVLDARGYFSVDLSMDKSIVFKLSEMLREHPLRSIRNESSKFIEAFRSMHQMIQDNCFILASNRTCEHLYSTPMLLLCHCFLLLILSIVPFL